MGLSSSFWSSILPSEQYALDCVSAEQLFFGLRGQAALPFTLGALAGASFRFQLMGRRLSDVV